MNRNSLLAYLPSLSESQIRHYLEASGWLEDGSIGDLATIWHRTEDGQYDAEVILPRQAKARDYKERVIDLLISIAEFENHLPSEIATAIINVSVDIVYIRVIHDDVESGTIPLDDGILLNEKARDLMTSAVLSAISKRKHFSGARPMEATEYLQTLRLGQTQVGSYVVNIIAPLPPKVLEQESSSIDTTSFTRMVTVNLATSLDALQNAINEFDDEDFSIFDEAVSKGVSANMCDALLGLSGDNKTRSFSISIAASTIEPSRLDSSNHYDFTPEGVAIMEKVSEHFKDNYVLENCTLLGEVTKLDRPSDAENGYVTIATTLRGVAKNVVFELVQSDYCEAIHAHEGKLHVECKGDIHVSPRTTRLLNPTEFRVLRDGELF
jgi:flagellar biosynthesis regulator FlaF